MLLNKTFKDVSKVRCFPFKINYGRGSDHVEHINLTRFKAFTDAVFAARYMAVTTYTVSITIQIINVLILKLLAIYMISTNLL